MLPTGAPTPPGGTRTTGDRILDAATAAGDLTGAFSHPHPRLHPISHCGCQLRDLGFGEPTADHQPWASGSTIVPPSRRPTVGIRPSSPTSSPKGRSAGRVSGVGRGSRR